MGWLNFRQKATAPQASNTAPPIHHPEDYTGTGKTKYGNLSPVNDNYSDPTERREASRSVYHDSLIGQGIVRRLMDSVINTGLTWESSPIWAMIKSAPQGEEQYKFTRNIENLWKLYSDSKEADTVGRSTLRQLQRQLLKLTLIDGEFFAIVRYMADPKRISPVTLQILNNDQIQPPHDATLIKAIEARGNTERDGVEFDANGAEVAIYVSEGYDKPMKRIPYFGTTGRRFVIHHANADAPGQSRGYPELSAFLYELSSLTDYDIAEIEATKSAAAFMGALETELGGKTGNGLNIAPATSNRATGAYAPKTGVESVDIEGKALILQSLPPGQKLHMYQPSRPNQNYENFIDAHETRICGALGIPLSVYKQQFQGSYSAARAEILFFWMSVVVRRDDFVAGFLSVFHEVVFTEWEKSGRIRVPGFADPLTKAAWLYGSWNGISRPVVDPVKEVKAVEARQKLGHTTGEREAKAYNGSDFQENVDRLKTENPQIAEANKCLDPLQYADPNDAENDEEPEDE